jgi:hypothetical protein
MPLTQITGPGGSVTFLSGFNGKFNNWTATINNPSVETTGFADNGLMTNEAGGPISMSGTVTAIGNFDAAATAPFPAAGIAATPTFSSWKGTITLTATTGCTFSCTIVVTAGTKTRGNAGRMDLTFTWISSGAITETWDET